MNETQLSQEAYEVVDSTSFSAVAVVAFLASLVGIFSIKYVQPMPLAIIGSAMGAFVLLTARFWNLNLLSKILGALAVIIGVTVLSWGLFERSLHTTGYLGSGPDPAKWVFVSLEGETIGTAGYSYKLKYRDEGQTNPPSYWVYARKDATRYEVRDLVRWYVDNVEPAK